jgi:hypothetical protein
VTIAEYKDIVENPFDGTKGWMTISTFDQRYGKPGKRYEELGFKYIKEAVASTGTIWVYLVRLESLT